MTEADRAALQCSVCEHVLADVRTHLMPTFNAEGWSDSTLMRIWTGPEVHEVCEVTCEAVMAALRGLAPDMDGMEGPG